MKTKPATHFQRIDVLRGLAILAVFLHHYWLRVGHNPALAESTALAERARGWFLIHEFGYLGVKLFFAISGFCIHHSYLNWRGKNQQSRLSAFLPGFVHRRFWRILPPYLAVLLPLFVWQYGPSFNFTTLKHLFVHVTLVNTLVPGFFYNVDPSFWSIAVEWQLYLIYPLILLIGLRLGWGAALGVSLVASAVFRMLLPEWIQTPYVLNLPFAWWYDWVIGAVLASAFAQQRRLFRGHLLWIAVLTPILVLDLVSWHLPALSWLLPPLLFAVLLEWCIWSEAPLRGWERGMAALGLCSYSFYLLHDQLTFLYLNHLHLTPLGSAPFLVWAPAMFILFGLIFAISWASFRWIEKGSVALGERIWQRHTRPPGATPAPEAAKTLTRAAP